MGEIKLPILTKEQLQFIINRNKGRNDSLEKLCPNVFSDANDKYLIEKYRPKGISWRKHDIPYHVCSEIEFEDDSVAVMEGNYPAEPERNIDAKVTLYYKSEDTRETIPITVSLKTEGEDTEVQYSPNLPELLGKVEEHLGALQHLTWYIREATEKASPSEGREELKKIPLLASCFQEVLQPYFKKEEGVESEREDTVEPIRKAEMEHLGRLNDPKRASDLGHAKISYYENPKAV